MKKNVFIIACMVMMAGMVWANDSEFFSSGNQLIPLKQTTIRVTKEVLSIDLRDDGTAFVDVQYDFTNPESQSKTILMGFEADLPYEGGYLELEKNAVHPFIKNFTVEMNGQKLKYKNAFSDTGIFRPINYSQIEERDGDHFVNKSTGKTIEGLSYVYYFEATFKPGVNKVHHTYSYKLGSSTEHFYYLDYKLSPAARWANKQIDDFTLIISAKKTAKHFFIETSCVPGMKPVVASGKGKMRLTTSYITDEKEWEIAVRNGAVKFYAKNFRPQEELSIHSGGLCGKLGETYDRGYSLVDCGYDSSRMNEELKSRILRNMPYANRGHVFKNSELKKFFESCFWYMPDPNYKDDTKNFTKNDWEYVNYKK